MRWEDNMPRRQRITKGLLTESAILARGAAHVLEVLRTRHPKSDDARLALRCALELEAWLTEQSTRVSDGAAAGGGSKGGVHGADRS